MSENADRLKELKIDHADKEGGSGGGIALAVTALILLLGAAGFFWWTSRQQVAVVELAAVQEVAAGGPRAASVLDASGYVTARRQATVSSKVTGKIVEVLIEEGLEVEEGQILARLDDSTSRRQLELTEAQLTAARSTLAETDVRIAEAKLNLKRLEKLVAGDVASQSELDTARAEVDSLVARRAVSVDQITVAERSLAVARQNLDDMVVRAPFSGIVVTKNAQPGEMISPVSAGGGFTRTGIGTVVDMSSLEIEVDVNESYINRVKPGQKVEAVLDAYQDWKIPATVIIAVPTADRQKATVKVRIGFDALDSRILPDMGVKVSFLDAEPEETTPAVADEVAAKWRIPSSALRSDGGSEYVFVVRDGKAERRAVGVSSRRDGSALINAGLKVGEQVVVSGPEDLADQDPVATQ